MFMLLIPCKTAKTPCIAGLHR